MVKTEFNTKQCGFRDRTAFLEATLCRRIEHKGLVGEEKDKAHTKQRKARLAILIPDKTEFRTQKRPQWSKRNLYSILLIRNVQLAI